MMEELRLYTVKDLKDWIEEGKPKEGLSEAVITPTRAYSFINNPYVTDDMPVVSALFYGEELAAFTAAFPERLARPDCMTHWINSLYVSPKYEGKGYALFVLGSLLECYEGNPVFDLDAMGTSVEILKYLGMEAKTFTRFSFREKAISCISLKGRVANVLENQRREKRLHHVEKRLQEGLQGVKYRLSYENFIDTETCDFIVTHSQRDLFLRQRESMNWMLHYPFVHEAPVAEKVQGKNLFSSSKKSQRYYVVKFYVTDGLVAVYIFRDSSTALSLDYLYYDAGFERVVFLSIIEHILRLGNHRFTTTNPKLAEMIRNWSIFPVYSEEHPSLCYPKTYDKEALLNIQGGDGDMFLS